MSCHKTRHFKGHPPHHTPFLTLLLDIENELISHQNALANTSRLFNDCSSKMLSVYKSQVDFDALQLQCLTYAELMEKESAELIAKVGQVSVEHICGLLMRCDMVEDEAHQIAEDKLEEWRMEVETPEPQIKDLRKKVLKQGERLRPHYR